MTIQDRIDCRMINDRFREGWREGTVEELTADYPFFKDYIYNINQYGYNRKIAILKSLDSEKVYHLYMFSEKYSYSINLSPKYMGCGMSCLYKRPLEDWTRGNDFPDGKPTEETFIHILYAILNNELVNYDDGTKKPTRAECEDTVEVDVVEERPGLGRSR